MLDPSKRRQRAHVWKAIEGFRCAHGRPVTLNWHPHRSDGWFDIEAHCEQGRVDGTRRAADALAQFQSNLGSVGPPSSPSPGGRER